MKETIYIFSSGRFMRKDNTLLFLAGEEEKKRFIPVERVKEILIFGEVDLNKRVLEFLSQKEIILSYFNHYGWYMGSFYPREHYNSGFMILKQASTYENYEKRLYLAKQFIVGAAKNSLKILKYYNRRDRDLDKQIEKIESNLVKLKAQVTIETSMAIEGDIKKTYYDGFNEIINNNEFTFTKRSKRPPKDYLNSLISFANSMIYNAVLGEIYQTHLDPRIAYLHSTNFRRFSLNLDVAEIFKPIVADRTIFSLLNKGTITENSFEKGLNGIMLKDSAKQKFLQAMEERMKQTIQHSTLNKKVSYRRLMRMELYKLEKHLMEEEEYKPFVMDW
jgi:CRISPR-associated protein Cas1